MANGYVGVGNKARLLRDIEVGVNDVARRVIRGYIGDENGKAQRWYKAWVTEDDLPFDFYQGAAVVYENRIHILGGEREPRKHYSWNGYSWREESTLPYNFVFGSAAVSEGEIHIFGGTSAMNAHYSWDGEEWHQRAGTPHYFYLNNLAVSFEGKIRLCSSGYGSYSQWGYIDTLNLDNTWSSLWMSDNSSFPIAVKYDRKIHMFPASGDRKRHKTWDGTSFGTDVAVPYDCTGGYGVMYNGKIHVIGAANGNKRMHYTFDGDTWERIATYPKNIYYCPAVVYKNKIHMLGGTNADDYRRHYSWEEDVPDIYSTEYAKANVSVPSGTKVITVNNGNRSPVSKGKGDAVCFAVKNAEGGSWGGNWMGTVSIALSAEAALLTAPNIGGRTGHYTIDGITYYVGYQSSNARWGGATDISSPIGVPIFQDWYMHEVNGAFTQAKIEEIIDVLGIRVKGVEID